MKYWRMPKVPRDVQGVELAKALKRFGYAIIRQKGSHMRLECVKNEKRQHLPIPAHSLKKIGTLNAILDDVASFLSMTKEELIEALF